MLKLITAKVGDNDHQVPFLSTVAYYQAFGQEKCNFFKSFVYNNHKIGRYLPYCCDVT